MARPDGLKHPDSIDALANLPGAPTRAQSTTPLFQRIKLGPHSRDATSEKLGQRFAVVGVARNVNNRTEPSPMTKITLVAALTLAALATDASAQSRQFYDSTGRVVGRSSADSGGTVTNCDSRGRVISRESTSGNTTTVYDARPERRQVHHEPLGELLNRSAGRRPFVAPHEHRRGSTCRAPAVQECA